MDYGVIPNVNGGVPFSRFLTFGPSGQLLPSVNLDGRGEKFAPGTCVGCHGGDRYAGAFPVDGSGKPDIGAHFLPYDAHNFSFSTQPGLTEADSAAALHQLNNLVLLTAPTQQTVDLIQGWYAAGTDVQDNDYLPLDWRPGGFLAQEMAPHGSPPLPTQSNVNSLADANVLVAKMYRNVVRESCRTCHAAAVKSFNLDQPSGDDGGFAPTGYDMWLRTSSTPTVLAGADPYTWGYPKMHSMPHALVTFNRFWNSAGSGTIDQPGTVFEFFGGPSNLNPPWDTGLTLLPDPSMRDIFNITGAAWSPFE